MWVLTIEHGFESFKRMNNFLTFSASYNQTFQITDETFNGNPTYLIDTWDEKMILKKLNLPSLSSSFLGWDRCQKSPHKFSKSGHWRILRKLHIWAYLPIWGHNFATDSPNDLIFWLRS